MIAPPILIRKRLSGRLGYRRGAFGRIILQVEIACDQVRWWGGNIPEEVVGTSYEYRDATVDDLLALGVKLRP